MSQVNPITRFDLESKVSNYVLSDDIVSGAIISTVFEASNIRSIYFLDKIGRVRWKMIPKSLSMYIIYCNTKLSLRETGVKLGAECNHATVLNNIKKIQNSLDVKDDAIVKLYDNTRKTLANEHGIYIPESGNAKVEKKPITKEVKEIYQYDFSGKLINCFSSIHEAIRITGIKSKLVVRAANNSDTAGGYYWSYSNKRNVIEKGRRFIRRHVYQLDLDGDIIAEFSSASEASRAGGCGRQVVWNSCRTGRRGGQYRWRYVDDDSYKPTFTKKEQREQARSSQPIFSA